MRFSFLVVLLFCLLMQAYGQQTHEDIADIRNQLEQVSDDSARAMLLADLAIRLKDRGNVTEARALLGRAKVISDELSNLSVTENVTLDFADYYLSTDRADSAIVVLERFLDRFPDSDRKVNMLNLLATAYRYQADFEKSLELFEKAKSLVDSSENPRTYNVINLNMAGIYGSMGDFGSALKYHKEGLEFIEASGDSLSLATVLNNLGNDYLKKSDFEQAKYYLQRSMSVSRAIDYELGQLRAFNNLANAEKNLGNPEEALRLNKQALLLHQKLKPDSPPFRLTYNLGDLQLGQGELGKAEESFQKSLEYSQQMGIPQGRYFNYTGLGAVAEQRGNLSRAITYFSKGAKIAKELGMGSERQEVTGKLYQLYKEKGDYKQALQFLEINKSITDSLHEVATEQKLAETESQLKLRREQQINQLLQEKQEQQQARITAQRWLLGVGVVVIVVILGSFFLLYRSFHQRKQINEQLEAQRNQLEELNNVKDKILAIISHDLRSPLTSMKGMLFLLREDELSKQEISRMATELEVSLNQNLNMMDNLLAWAREQMSGMAINLDEVDAHLITSEVIENYKFQAEHKDIQLSNNVPEGLVVEADFNMLKLILRNLISNGIKFSEQGGEVTVSTRRKEDKIVFEIADTGIGIPTTEKEELFTVGSGSRSGTQNEKGSGLGLQLCKEFVEKQNGDISVQSTEGEGTTFYFTLPKAS